MLFQNTEGSLSFVPSVSGRCFFDKQAVGLEFGRLCFISVFSSYFSAGMVQTTERNQGLERQKYPYRNMVVHE